MGKFTVIGGDKRNIALAEMLFRQGHDVRLFGCVNNERELPMQCKLLNEAIREAQYIIGPTPCSLGGGALNAPFHNGPLYVEDLFRLIEPHQVFIAGYVKPEVLKLAEEYGIHIIDMLKREELLVLNAIPTALQLGDKKILFRYYHRLCKRLCIPDFLRLLCGEGILPVLQKIR